MLNHSIIRTVSTFSFKYKVITMFYIFCLKLPMPSFIIGRYEVMSCVKIYITECIFLNDKIIIITY